MADAFPFFDDVMIEQIGAASVYASFLEKGRRDPILASGASDGVLQLLLLLIALFSEGDRRAVLLFDEPEVSLHPWALVVFAKAVKEAAERWNKQVFLATHSPVLISQFEPEETLVAAVEGGSDRHGERRVVRGSIACPRSTSFETCWSTTSPVRSTCPVQWRGRKRHLHRSQAMVFPGRDSASEWRFVHFGLIVTGKGEREFLHLFRSLADSRPCPGSTARCARGRTTPCR